MTRLFTDGAEMGDLLFWDVATSVALGTAAPAPYDGTYYYKNSGVLSVQKVLPAAVSEIYQRARLYFNGLDSRDIWLGVIGVLIGSDLLYLGTDNSHRLLLEGYGITTVTSTFTLNTGQWYLFETYYKLADAPNGRAIIKVDGTTIIDFTGDTKYGSETGFTQVHFTSYGGICLDDLGANDTAGGVDDSWLGDGSIVKVVPDGNGAHNNWHGSDGNDVNNFELVDDFPNDGDTTYVYHDSTASGTQDQYAMSDYSGTGKTISRIYAEGRAKLSAASANQVKIGLLPSGGTDQMSSGISLGSGAYKRIVGNEYLVNPVDSGAWEEADIDALEGVIEVA